MNSKQAQSKREMPIAEVVRLIDFVNYQEGAVVSRTLINRATGTVTLFAFDERQRVKSAYRSVRRSGTSAGGRSGNCGFGQANYGRRQAKRFSCQQVNFTR
jgi:hypothetical protein